MADGKNEITVIGPGTTIKGEMTFTQSAEILGTIEGKIVAENDLVIGEKAICNAEVIAGTALVDGTIDGNVTVKDRIQLNRTARVQGDLVAKTLMVAEGASYTGHCRVGSDVDLSGRLAETKASQTPAPAPAPSVKESGSASLIEERESQLNTSAA